MRKPIVYFDLETTGTSTENDQITQYAFLKIHPNGTNQSIKSLVKPSIPISEGAAEVTGITDETVKDAKPFSYYASSVANFIEGCILVGYNIIGFDVPLLANEMLRNDCVFGDKLYDMEMIDAMVLYGKYRPRTLTAAFEDLTGDEMPKDAHDAMVDVNCTRSVVNELSSKMFDFKDDHNEALVQMIKESKKEGAVDFAGKLKLVDGKVCFAFGKKHNGDPVMQDQSTRGYAKWMLREEFPAQTKNILNKILNGEKI